MVTGFIVLSVMMAIVGLVVGMLVGKAIVTRRYARDTQYTQGTINVDCSASTTRPCLFLGSSIPVEEIMTRSYVTFDIKVLHLDSHE